MAVLATDANPMYSGSRMLRHVRLGRPSFTVFWTKRLFSASSLNSQSLFCFVFFPRDNSYETHLHLVVPTPHVETPKGVTMINRLIACLPEVTT